MRRKAWAVLLGVISLAAALPSTAAAQLPGQDSVVGTFTVSQTDTGTFRLSN